MKKFLAIVLALAAALSLTACGGGKEEPANSLEDIISSGTLTVALSPDFAPMEFIDPSKEGMEQYQGFDIELAKYIAAKLSEKYDTEITVQIEAMDFETCQLAVGSKQVHMSISGYSWTEERAENYLISDFYYAGDNESEQWVIAYADQAAALSTAADFDGVSVAAQNASLQLNMVNEQLPNAEAVIVTSLDTAILELVNHKVDALACAQGQAEVFISQYPEIAKCGFQFEVSEAESANAILMPLGESELCEVVNEILAQAYASGVYDEWYTDSVAYAKALGHEIN